MKKKYLIRLIFCLMVILIFSSCLGLSMDIAMKRDGSGRVVLEYIMPSVLQNLGILDGNESWPTIPIGRADFQRAIEGIDGARLVSFSSREKGKDYFINAVLDFDNPQALAKIIGEGTSLSDGKLSFIFLDKEDLQNIDADLIELFKSGQEGKKLSLSFTKDGSTSGLKITDNQGNEIQPSETAGQVVSSGKKVSFSIDSMNLFDYTDGLEVHITW